jgi:Carboxypeptidase regulatory-like domain
MSMKPILITLLAVFLIMPCARGQSSAGAVSGTVRDQTGAVIPGAAVSIVNTATNVKVLTRANEAGFYLFPGVAPGSYVITVEFTGMQKYEGNVAVQVSQSVVIDPTLQAAGSREVVEIRDVTPLVTTDNATVGAAMERTRIEQLPINGRNITTLLSQVPGIENQRAYGTRFGAIEYSLDGSQEEERRWGNAPQISLESLQEFRVDVNAVSAKYSRPTNVVLSTRSGTNQIHGSVFETFRNSAIGVARRRQDTFTKAPYLNRHEFGFSLGGPVVIPHVYNGKNKTFWFASYEGRRQLTTSTAQYSVPTEAMRNGDFSDLRDSQGRLISIYDPLTTNPQTYERQQFSYNGRANVIDPARISPVAKFLFGITRLPTNNVNPLIDVNWIGTIDNPSKQYNATQRVDHRFSEKDSFYVRTTVADSWGKNNAPLGQIMLDEVYGREINTERRMSIGATWVHTFGPTFFNELLVSGRRIAWFGGNYNPNNTNYVENLGVPNPFDVKTEAAPQFTSLGIPGYEFRENTWKRHAFNNLTIDNNATKIIGRHEIQFGAHYRYDQLNILPDQTWREGLMNFNTAATTLYDPSSTPINPQGTPQTGSNIANMFLGYANFQYNQNRRWFYLRGGEYAAYVQDNFKMSSRLTVNLGLRWEYWPTYSEKHGSWTSFNPENHAVVTGTSLENMYALGDSVPSLVARYQELGLKFQTYQEAGIPRNFLKTGKRDFGPRFGFAYRVGDGRKGFVIRGGYSVAYFPIPMWTFVDRMFVNTPVSAAYTNDLNNATQSPDGIPNYLLRTVPQIILGVNSKNAIDLGKVPGINPGSSQTTYFAKDMPTSRIHTWNFTLEKQIGASIVVRARYVGNRGANLDQYYSYNANPPDFVWYASTKQPLPTGNTANVVRRPFDSKVWGTIQEYRKTGWSNYNGIELEIERRFNRGLGFQLFYLTGNNLAMTTSNNTDTIGVQAANQFLPGAVSTDYQERNRFLNYQRDTSVPKHRIRWNWVADLPFGKGKKIAGNSTGVVDKLIGGWQIAGIGSLNSTYTYLSTGNWNFTGEPVHQYGYKYPIEDCRSGICIPGYLWWNDYIPANQINSRDANGKPNGVMGVPANYKPAVTPLIPWGSTALPANAPANTVISQFWDTNNVWLPLNNGTVQRVTYNNNLHPWRNQPIPSVIKWGLDASLFKNFKVGEQVNVRVGADFFNVLNHPVNQHSVSGGILYTRNSDNAARTLQFNARVNW